MGGPMAQRLRGAGHDVTGYNRTRWLADSPRAVAEVSEVTLSMLRDTQALLDVAEGAVGLGPGKVP